MSTGTLVVIFISSLLTVVISVISYLLKDYLKGWKGETKTIRMQLVQSNDGMNILLKSFHEFEKELIKIEGALASINREQTKANENIKEAKILAFSNRDKIKSQEHDISNLTNNYAQYSKLVIENADRIKKLEDSLLVFKLELKA